MGLDWKAETLRRESGYSPTVLRRRLSQLPEIRTPPWAADKTVATALVPLMLVSFQKAARPNRVRPFQELQSRPNWLQQVVGACRAKSNELRLFPQCAEGPAADLPSRSRLSLRKMRHPSLKDANASRRYAQRCAPSCWLLPCRSPCRAPSAGRRPI